MADGAEGADEAGKAGEERLRRLMAAIVGIGAELDLEIVLHRIIETATDLVDATYGALGVLNVDRTHLSQFITVGIDEERRRRIGALPKGHGILGLLIVQPEPIRLPDLALHPDSYGFPPEHPSMQSFLGVPLFVRGEVYGNLYLTDKRGAAEFTRTDQELTTTLASAAAVAIDNARLHSRVREVDLIEERERIARDLHDTVIQRLFSTGLSLQGAIGFVERPEAVVRIEHAVDDLDATVREIRTAIFELHEQRGPVAGLRRELLAVGSDLAAALGFEPTFQFEGPVDTMVPGDVASHVVAVVREGLANVARHAGAERAAVVVRVDGGSLALIVSDTGRGPQPPRAGGRGLANVIDRAVALGGTARLEAGAVGGSQLVWEIPLT